MTQDPQSPSFTPTDPPPRARRRDRASALVLQPIQVASHIAAAMLSREVWELKTIPFEQLPYARRKRNRYYRVASLEKFAAEEERVAIELGDDPSRFAVPVRKQA